MRRRAAPRVIALAVAALLGAARPAVAAPASQPATAPALPPPPPVTVAPAPRLAVPRLTVDWRIDGPVTGVLAVTLVATEYRIASLAPAACHWCQSNAFDRAGRDLRWGAIGTADALSYVTLFLTPAVTVALLGLDAYPAGGLRRWADDTLIAAEATALAGVLTQAVKLAAGRQRPFVRALPPADRAHTSDPADNNLSFFSGHASLAFAAATSVGTVATLRRYRLAPYVWAAGLTLAALTAYLRVAADKHYATDVLTGAAVGAAVGWAVPYLHYRLKW
ncbi:MAG TPA: phosphatase PAP2 family protein [Polyangia bacterium]|jgi:membrane-associated phospholipid phosphatase